MPIVPDDKNWTWVLQRACPDCGFDAASFDPTTIGTAIAATVADFRELLQNPHAAQRPDEHTWSAVEYGCHVRDVYRLYLYRLDLMMAEGDPLFENWDQDVAAIADRYDEQTAGVVGLELEGAADMLSARYATVRADQWSRTGRRGDGAVFTIDSFTRYLIHDPVHHVWDVRNGYAALDG